MFYRASRARMPEGRTHEFGNIYLAFGCTRYENSDLYKAGVGYDCTLPLLFAHTLYFASTLVAQLVCGELPLLSDKGMRSVDGWVATYRVGVRCWWCVKVSSSSSYD